MPCRMQGSWPGEGVSKWKQMRAGSHAKNASVRHFSISAVPGKTKGGQRGSVSGGVCDGITGGDFSLIRYGDVSRHRFSTSFFSPYHTFLYACDHLTQKCVKCFLLKITNYLTCSSLGFSISQINGNKCGAFLFCFFLYQACLKENEV